jgi:hypothetical protein
MASSNYGSDYNVIPKHVLSLHIVEEWRRLPIAQPNHRPLNGRAIFRIFLHEEVNVVDERVVRLDESRIELHRAAVTVVLPTVAGPVAFVRPHHRRENRRLCRSQEKFLE